MSESVVLVSRAININRKATVLAVAIANRYSTSEPAVGAFCATSLSHRRQRAVVSTPLVSNSNPDLPAPDQLTPQERPERRIGGVRLHTRHWMGWLSRSCSTLLLACLESGPLSLTVECLPEIRNLVHRIAFVCKHRPDLHGVDLGQFFEKTSCGTYRVNRRTRGCSEDIKRFLAARPWLTAVDVSLIVEAWTRGVEWCARNHSEQ